MRFSPGPGLRVTGRPVTVSFKFECQSRSFASQSPAHTVQRHASRLGVWTMLPARPAGECLENGGRGGPGVEPITVTH